MRDAHWACVGPGQPVAGGARRPASASGGLPPAGDHRCAREPLGAAHGRRPPAAAIRAQTVVDPHRVPVILVPGFLSGDFALGPMSEPAAQGRPLDRRSPASPRTSAARRSSPTLVEARVEKAAAETGRSRRDRRLEPRRHARQDRRRSAGPSSSPRSITLGTPNTDPLAVNATLATQLALITRLHAFGVPGLLGEDCISGECGADGARLCSTRTCPRTSPTRRCSPWTTASSTGAPAWTPARATSRSRPPTCRWVPTPR